MTTQQLYSQQTEATKRRINRAAVTIRQCGSAHFYTETGCYADDPANWWLLVEMAMDRLRISR